MKTYRLSLFTIALIIISILAITVVQAQTTVTSGVYKDEIFNYDYSLTWTSDNPSATPPAELIELNNTQTIQFKITSVSGSSITYDFIKHYKDSTQTQESKTIDISTGTMAVPYYFIIVGANLNKGQQVYPSGGYQTISDTITRSYTSGDRQTNILSGPDQTIYYDKIKGLAVEITLTYPETVDGYATTTIERLVNTNSDAWTTTPTPPPTPTPTPTASPSPTPHSATKTPANPTSAATVPPQTGTPNNPTNNPANPTNRPNSPTNSPNGQSTNPGYSVINGTIEQSSDILIIAVIAIVIGVVLVVVLLTVRKKGARKQKTPKEGKAKKDKDESEQNDFDLSGFNLK